MHKKALLAVSFGTSHADTREKAIGGVEKALAAAFPGHKTVRAFTSQKVIDLCAGQGLCIPTPAQAMDQLRKRGFTHVLVQPLHIIHGFEYEKLCRQIAPYMECMEVTVSTPLLSEPLDYPALAGALSSRMDTADGHARVWLGHGTAHPADAAYPRLQQTFHEGGYPHCFVGTVEGSLGFDQVAAALKTVDCRRVTLLPLMLVAGDHARNDMAGDEPDSWKSRLVALGLHTHCVLTGLGELPAVQALYVDKARRACAKKE